MLTHQKRLGKIHTPTKEKANGVSKQFTEEEPQTILPTDDWGHRAKSQVAFLSVKPADVAQILVVACW